MYEKFGFQNETFRVKREQHPVLIWKNIKLFNNHNIYIVYATGFDNNNNNNRAGNQVKSNRYNKQVKGINHGIYASIIVLDSSGKDCLSNDNKILKSQYFNIPLMELKI